MNKEENRKFVCFREEKQNLLKGDLSEQSVEDDEQAPAQYTTLYLFSLNYCYLTYYCSLICFVFYTIKKRGKKIR